MASKRQTLELWATMRAARGDERRFIELLEAATKAAVRRLHMDFARAVGRLVDVIDRAGVSGDPGRIATSIVIRGGRAYKAALAHPGRARRPIGRIPDFAGAMARRRGTRSRSG